MNLKVHLGCGNRYLPGFVHVDMDPHPHVDHVHDIGQLPMFDHSVADVIYTCGAFIYFDRDQAIEVLKEWRRVLKPGGTLRLSVPDFSSIVKVYQQAQDADSKGILGPLFGKWRLTNGQYVYQRTAYDFASLSRLLLASGFSDVKRYDWKKVLPAGYDDYSRAYMPHGDESGLQMCLNVECVKK